HYDDDDDVDSNKNSDFNNSSWNHWKTSIVSLVLFILFSIILLLSIYWIAARIGHCMRHQHSSKETLIRQEESKEPIILRPTTIDNYSYTNGGMDTSGKARIYSAPPIYYPSYEYAQSQRYPTKCYIDVQHDQRTGQTYSRTLQNSSHYPYYSPYRIPSYYNYDHRKVYLRQNPEQVILT
ncbi:unnamed protein product, partial [Didymodactylos carnosus]